MGNVLALMIPAMIGLAGQVILSLAFPRPGGISPSLADIQAHNEAEEAQRRAEQCAEKALELAEEMRLQAKQEREEARARQELADKAAAHAAAEIAHMREQVEEAMKAASRAHEAAANAAGEEVLRLTREAQEERERTQRMRAEAERVTAAVREEAKTAQKVADEERRQAEAGKVRAEELARTAAEEARKAMAAKEEAERCLREGIQPIVTPTPEELIATKRRVEYKEDRFHFAIAGISGSGKSSLVNAFRGLQSQDPDAAAADVIETTLQMTRYPDPNPKHPFVWYDIPGAGTLECPDWQYFNDQGLYVFDCIIILFDNRFTTTDVAILVHARRFNIPTYIVRSKADQHIRNVMREMGYESDEDGKDVDRRDTLYKAARERFIETTRKSVQMNLKDANLPQQRVYIVSNSTMLRIVQNKLSKKAIDEVDLVNDLLQEAYRRRAAQSDN